MSAGEIHQAARADCSGMNQLKAFTSCGMGPCQGRMCGHNAAVILADTQQRHVSETGYARPVFPLSPSRWRNWHSAVTIARHKYWPVPVGVIGAARALSATAQGAKGIDVKSLQYTYRR
ncbi:MULTISPECIES: hypothetical protein [Symbiopectobacterium]|uniref:hypothetical protein n=1 Tax=Symbiopectobacterium TaxID=801 RepID=UPI001A1D8902|nr:hypothetical protein [Candidatus Symbiopectobacterium sp. PLON1]MBT9430142.1 (2Fe-2S)-binding protein [Candidatus Symbiopectobacterium endolongispinus]